MGFTKALYYPTIDINNEEWLKNAILFWDEINTIVPSSIKSPYKEDATHFLSDEGLLNPITVSPDDYVIEELANDTLNYLNTNEGFQLLTQGQGENYVIHRDKLPREVSELFDIHPDKLPWEIQRRLKHNLRDDGWFEVNSNFAIFYMTLLANKICEQKSIALLSDNNLTANFTDKFRLDNQIAIHSRRERHFYSRQGDEKYINLAQGLLTNLVISGIKVLEHSSFHDILNFKKRHRDELGHFRTNIAKLTEKVSEEKSLEAIQQDVTDIYQNEFLPSYNNFKSALNSSGIKWISENIIKVSVVSTSATAFQTALLGLSLPQALLASAGISLVSSIISYNQDKKEKLITNPYSYLLAVENKM
jgi:Family of unknown function (DUF6236)